MVMLDQFDSATRKGRKMRSSLPHAVGARYDTMEPAQMQKIASSVKKGRYLFCPNGSHFDMYDDQSIYVTGVIQFILDVDSGRF